MFTNPEKVFEIKYDKTTYRWKIFNISTFSGMNFKKVILSLQKLLTILHVWSYVIL